MAEKNSEAATIVIKVSQKLVKQPNKLLSVIKRNDAAMLFLEHLYFDRASTFFSQAETALTLLRDSADNQAAIVISLKHFRSETRVAMIREQYAKSGFIFTEKTCEEFCRNHNFQFKVTT